MTTAFKLGCLALLTAQHVLITQCMSYGRTSGTESFSTAVLQLHSELIKFAVSGAVLLRQEPSSLQSSVFTSKAAMPMAVPAGLYFLQNCLGLFAVKHVSVPMLAVTSQTKVVTSAVFSMSLLGRTFTGTQWRAVVQLGVGAAVVVLASRQGAPDDNDELGGPSSTSSATGLFALLGAYTLSGVNNVFVEKVAP